MSRFCGVPVRFGRASEGLRRGRLGVRILPIDSRAMEGHARHVELETVFETLNAAEAQLIRSRLAAAGLNAEVDPEIDPLSTGAFSHAGGGVQVKVPTAEAEQARAILAAFEGAEP